MNIFSLLDAASARHQGYAAVCDGDECIATYGELRGRSLALAGSIRGMAGADARVAIATENCPQYVEILFGIWAAGAVAVPLNYKLHAKEMAQIVDDAGAQIVLVSAVLYEGIAALLAERAVRIVVIGSAEYGSLLNHETVIAARVQPESLAWLFYTSGTTGRSKGAMLSHRNLMAMTIGHLADIENMGEGASLVHAAPMSHGSGLYILPYVARGARQVIPSSGGFDPAEFLDLCDRHPECSAFLAPTMIQRLRIEAERSGRRARNLRTVVYGGGPMYVDELKKSLAVFGQVFVQIYGQGESPMTITCLRRAHHDTSDDRVLGSVGQARTGVEVAVVDDRGEPLPCGELGEIVCRGDVVMSGYWRNPAATAEALRNGWLFTGDIGSLDAQGFLTLRDRSKDVVISGGSNIYPREVEEVLLTHPLVGEVCVVGQEDAEWGEIVVAFIVKVSDSELSASELDKHCLASIARFKRPKHYHFVDSLPKNSYGKVLKRELRTLLPEPQPSVHSFET